MRFFNNRSTTGSVLVLMVLPIYSSVIHSINIQKELLIKFFLLSLIHALHFDFFSAIKRLSTPLFSDQSFVQSLRIKLGRNGWVSSNGYSILFCQIFICNRFRKNQLEKWFLGQVENRKNHCKPLVVCPHWKWRLLFNRTINQFESITRH